MSNLICKIQADIAIQCGDGAASVKGTTDEIYIIAKSDINSASITKNTNNPIIVEAITQLATKRAYKWEFVRNSLMCMKDMVKGDINKWKQGVSARIAANTSAIKLELENLAKSQEGYVVFVKSNYKGDATESASWEIFGLDSPLFLNACTDSEDNKIWSIELSNEDGYESPTIPYTLFKTNATTTTAIVEALAVASSV